MRHGLYILMRAALESEATLALTGEVDMMTCSLMGTAIADLIDRGYRDLSVDMSEVTYFDCSGIYELVLAWTRLSETGGSIKVTVPSRIVQRIMNITGLDALVDWIPDAEQLPVPVGSEVGTESQRKMWEHTGRTQYPELAGSSVANN